MKSWHFIIVGSDYVLPSKLNELERAGAIINSVTFLQDGQFGITYSVEGPDGSMETVRDRQRKVS